MKIKDFELIPHTADLKIRVYGADYHELFANALRGMFQAIRPIVSGCAIEQDRVVCKELPARHHIKISSSSYETLLVDFLSEALYLSDVNNEAYLDVLINTLIATEVDAELFGIAVQGFEVVEIKAVTYHDLAIRKKNDHMEADIVFDI